MKVDVIIVGQGIAGSLLAWRLHKEGLKLCIIDNANEKAASLVAAGLFNPVVFKRYTESWMAEELLEEVNSTYREMELQLGISFYHERPLLKIFATHQEAKMWEDKKSSIPFLSERVAKDSVEGIKMPFGGGIVKGAGHVSLKELMDGVSSLVKKHHHLLREKFDFSGLLINGASVNYKDITAGKIVFCEGFQGIMNPYFDWLPLKATKGEVIRIAVDHVSNDYILNKGCYMLPCGKNEFTVGSTYEWGDVSCTTTEKAREELLLKVKAIVSDERVRVVEQQAGIRPTVIDRRPLVGVHPDVANMYILNGLGTKGVMLAPFFSMQLIRYMYRNEPIHHEADVARFKQAIQKQ